MHFPRIRALTHMLVVSCCVTAPLALQNACAQLPEPFKGATNKNDYALFEPTPVEQMREMTTDSLGATETPYTVDAGHFQIELTLLRYAYDREQFAGETVKTESWAIAPFLLKAGLMNTVDVEMMMEPYEIIRERGETNSGTFRGFGDVTLRVKANLWGNDEGATAFALVPYVTLPTRDEELGHGKIGG
jgi:hypothetical protein